MDSSSSAGVSIVQAGSCITLIGTDRGWPTISLRPMAVSVTPPNDVNSAADKVVGIAIMRGREKSVPQWLVPPPEALTSVSPVMSPVARPDPRATSMALVASITEPPPSATTPSARSARKAATRRATATIGECAGMSATMPAQRSPSSARTRSAMPLRISELVVISSGRCQPKASSSRGKAVSSAPMPA